MRYGDPQAVAFTERLARELAVNGWRAALELAQRLQTARQELTLPGALAKLDEFDPLILDDLSYVEKDQADVPARISVSVELSWGVWCEE